MTETEYIEVVRDVATDLGISESQAATHVDAMIQNVGGHATLTLLGIVAGPQTAVQSVRFAA